LKVLINLDSIDEAIIALLQADGRLSNRAVARELGLSEGAIRTRLKRLTEEGAITYGVVINNFAMGLLAGAWIYAETLPAEASRVGRWISNLERCTFCIICTGRFNLMAFIFAADRAGLSDLVALISHDPGIRRLEVRETLAVPLHRYEYIRLPDTA
jgi:Lrp/AsnC family transcriptional regulator, regulator for asnA, asnC and gidA